jgi:hypothetical protein
MTSSEHPTREEAHFRVRWIDFAHRSDIMVPLGFRKGCPSTRMGDRGRDHRSGMVV